MEPLAKELIRLVFDYDKCPIESIKEQILHDINLLREAQALLIDEKETNIEP